MLQYAFGSLSVTAEKPKLGLIVTIILGVLNMTGDVLFMGVFHWGIAGAAMATAMGQIDRRNDTAGLFPAEEQQQPAPSQTKVGWRSAQACLHQRCIEIDEQYFYVHCRHAV